MHCEEAFFEKHRKIPEKTSFCPYRVCPMGAHSDHQYGKITGFAIDEGIYLAYCSEDSGNIVMDSLNFAQQAQWNVADIPQRQNDWADYLRGATRALAQHHVLHRGLSGMIEGSMPIGGLSSSAAVILAFLRALCEVNELRLSPEELIEVALCAETDYVGVSVGKMDQSCEVHCRKDHLLYLDTRDGSFECILAAPTMKPFKIAVFFSGVERTLVGSRFNMRVDELKAAAYALKGYALMDGREDQLEVPYGRFVDARLRDVPRELYDDYKERLPLVWRKRAEHFYTEFARVEAGAEAWRRGDLAAFGRLSTESGWSSIYNYETGSDELKVLYEAMIHADGVYGGRFSGAGFKGCCMALVDPAFEESIRRSVSTEYLKAFPRLAEKFSVHFCHTEDGLVAREEKL